MAPELYLDKSTVIRMVKYGESSMHLEIEFVSGSVYVYMDVPPRLWKLFLLYTQCGGSAGIFFNKFIKNDFEVNKILEV